MIKVTDNTLKLAAVAFESVAVMTLLLSLSKKNPIKVKAKDMATMTDTNKSINTPT